MITGRLVSHAVRDRAGNAVAIHWRRYRPDGLKGPPWWELLDGTPSLRGRRTTSLPLYGIHRVDTWSRAAPVYLTEGEPATDSLVAAGYQAAATVTGAAGCPDGDVLQDLAGFDVRCWPDADEPGRRHMVRVGAALRGVANGVVMVAWPDAPPGGDAVDFLRLHDASHVVRLQLKALKDQPRSEAPRRYWRRDVRLDLSPIEDFNRRHPVSVVLTDFGVAKAVRGRTIRCPSPSHAHGDRRPSLAIFGDDRRAFCHLASCPLNGSGHGVDAYDVATILGR